MMFAGMITLNNTTLTHKIDDVMGGSCDVTADGVTDSRHRRSFRRPGYMRTEPLSQLDAAVSLPRITSCDSHRNLEIHNRDASPNTSTSELPISLDEKWLGEALEREDSSNCQATSKPNCKGSSRTVPSCDVFNSSFSFIQQSLDTSDFLDTSSVELPPSLDQPKSQPSNSSALKHILQSRISPSGVEVFTSGPLPCSIGQSVKRKGLLLDGELWLKDLNRHWDKQISSSMTSDFKERVSDCGSMDAEVTSSLSVDSSDSTSASSVTSGYESATSFTNHSRNSLRKSEVVLQDCLQKNRANTKIKSMMLNLQRLQHRAVLEDDYDAAERFGQKLADLHRERGTRKASLPSRHPSVSEYLQTLRMAVHSALHRNSSQNREKHEDIKTSANSSDQHERREKLIRDKHRIQREICDVQRRLEKLQEESRVVEMQLALEEDMPVLKDCDVAQLQLMCRALEEMMTSEHRAHLNASPTAEIIRLQEQEQALSSSIKEATAKVLMSQKLSAGLRRKVNETETQLLALQEAKLAAISGSDFSSTKELKTEIRNVYGERDRLETLMKKLQMLSTGSAQELTRMKQKLNQIKLNLQRRDAQSEHGLKENTQKYIKVLEEQRHSCRSSALEHIWEAELEACHLLLSSLELRTPSLAGNEDLPSLPESNISPCTEEEADCAMLTALGGRWCPDANLQHSEFTKKLEEFLFCVEDGPEDLCGEEAEIMVRCDLIRVRLHYLEDQLHTAMENNDKCLALSLEKDVQEVKATLHLMLSHLKLEDEDDDDEDKFCDVEDGQEENGDIEEELYFSDSWEI